MIKTLIMGFALSAFTTAAFAQNTQNIADLYDSGYRLEAVVTQGLGIVIKKNNQFATITAKSSLSKCYINMKSQSSTKSRILKQGRVIQLQLTSYSGYSLRALVSSDDKSVYSVEYGKTLTTVDELESACEGVEFNIVPNTDYLDEASLYDTGDYNDPQEV